MTSTLPPISCCLKADHLFLCFGHPIQPRLIDADEPCSRDDACCFGECGAAIRHLAKFSAERLMLVGMPQKQAAIAVFLDRSPPRKVTVITWGAGENHVGFVCRLEPQPRLVTVWMRTAQPVIVHITEVQAVGVVLRPVTEIQASHSRAIGITHAGQIRLRSEEIPYTLESLACHPFACVTCRIQNKFAAAEVANYGQGRDKVAYVAIVCEDHPAAPLVRRNSQNSSTVRITFTGPVQHCCTVASCASGCQRPKIIPSDETHSHCRSIIHFRNASSTSALRKTFRKPLSMPSVPRS